MGGTGAVRGLRRYAEDTFWGIHAVDSTGRVRPHDLYLIGSSIGGGGAWNAAGALSHVRAVVVIRPWVGLNMIDPWETQPAPPHTVFSSQLTNELARDGRHPWSAVLAQQSPAMAPFPARGQLRRTTTYRGTRSQRSIRR